MLDTAPQPDPAQLTLHHLAVQTADLDASISWYRDFLGADVTWTLDTFSDLSMERLPGLSGLAEVVVGGLRFHLFTRGPEHAAGPPADTNQFQHACIEVRSPEQLRLWRERWIEVYETGGYTFVRDVPPTEIVVDSDGVESFYAFDVNGIEFEFTYLPGERTT
ncbi:VOC family protein [Streptomyces sp. NPDC006314]|uniref:VOC family protein n=1 Tax=Streptomyces sp. NPDC006314 TaxID=3154475 RepID=UPI0033BBB66F